jgi:catechol 2,3-dioxygenase-like lactoylglutathione lyase family enzyme
MIKGISHFALAVDDLEKAEAFYRQLFDNMCLIGRESLQDDGEWYTLLFDKTWEDADEAGVELNMVALRKDNLVLALFQVELLTGEQIIGLSVSQDEIGAIRGRLTPEITLMIDQVDHLDLIDPYQVMWQIGVNPVFQTAGEFAGRWLVL